MMDSAERPTRERDWLAFVLPVLGFCVVDCLAAIWLSRGGSGPTFIAVLGMFTGQLLWGAVWCAIGPGRWVRRFISVVAEGVLVSGVMMAGIYSQDETPPPRDTVVYRSGGVNVYVTRVGPAAIEPGPRESARNQVLMGVSAFPLALLIVQFPLLGIRALRGWRIVFREKGGRIESSDSHAFGIADLFAVTAAVAIVLGFLRIQSGVAADELGDGLARAVVWAGFAFISGLLALIMAPLTLGARPQRLSLKLLLCAYIVLLGVIAPASAVLMIYPSLWIARDVGYRLVRLPRG